MLHFFHHDEDLALIHRKFPDQIVGSIFMRHILESGIYFNGYSQ